MNRIDRIFFTCVLFILFEEILSKTMSVETNQKPHLLSTYIDIGKFMLVMRVHLFT